MERKKYFTIYSVLQFVLGIYGFFTAHDMAVNSINMMRQVSKELADSYTVASLTSFYKVSMLVSAIIGLILLVTILKKKDLSKNWLTMMLIIVSILISGDIVSALAIIALIFLLSSKKNNSKKEKKKLEKVPRIKTSNKDYFSAAILAIVYFGQIACIPLLNALIKNAFLSELLYDLVIFAVVFWAFREQYKRDFKYLKGDFSLHVFTAFKYWALMLGVVFAVGFIQVLLGANIESANQSALKELPILNLIFSAVIFAPIVEEAIFRGAVRRFISNDVLFIIVSGLIFGLLHTFMAEDTLYLVIVQSLNYMAMGAVLAYSYTKTNNIFTSMMVHAMQNTFGVIMMILQMFL